MKLPAGKYYIGDPCYVFDESWDRLLESTNYLQNKGPVDFDGYTLFAYSTAYGDGTYTDQHGNEYPVDAGLLGAIPIELIEVPSGEEDGTILDAPNGLEVYHDNGTFYFGDIIIKTDETDPDDFGDPYGEGEDDFI